MFINIKGIKSALGPDSKYMLLWIGILFTGRVTAKDSTLSITGVFGSYAFLIDRDLASVTGADAKIFSEYQIDFARHYYVGLKLNKGITTKKTFCGSVNFSHSFIGYQYTTRNGVIIQEQNGYVYLKGLVMNTHIQYQAFKWLKLNYGLSHYINFSDRFDNTEIAKDVGWYDANGKSNRQPYSISLLFGVEFPVYKRFSIELQTMRGLNKFITLQFKDRFISSVTKLRYGGLTFNYRIL